MSYKEKWFVPSKIRTKLTKSLTEIINEGFCVLKFLSSNEFFMLTLITFKCTIAKIIKIMKFIKFTK